jgi:hypothetical protein
LLHDRVRVITVAKIDPSRNPKNKVGMNED